MKKKHRVTQSLLSLLALAVAPFMGATVSAQTVLHVDDNAVGVGDGFSWSTAFSDLQDALDLARSNPDIEEIWVAGGTYYPDRGTDDRDATFALVSNVGVYGGFQGNETTRPPRLERISETILSGDIGIPDDPSDNSKTVVSSMPDTDSAEIENTTIIRGNGTWGSGLNVRARSVGIRIVGCRFRDNNGVFWGGGAC